MEWSAMTVTHSLTKTWLATLQVSGHNIIVQWRRKMFCCRGAENMVPRGGLTSGLRSQ